MRALAVLARPLLPDFLDGYTTVIGSTVYLPDLPHRIPRDLLACILCHELVHQLDQRRFGPLFYLTYAIPPAGRTVRAVWERRAYTVDLLVAREVGGDRGLSMAVDRLVTVFSGAGYGWMWAGRVAARAFLAPTVEAVASRSVDREAPYDSIIEAWRG